MNLRNPWLLSVSGPLRLAWALPNNPKSIVFSSGNQIYFGPRRTGGLTNPRGLFRPPPHILCAGAIIRDCVAGRSSQASPNARSSFVKRILLAAALAATTAIAVPMIARSAEDAETQQARAQVAQADEQSGEEHGGGPGQWMRGEGGPGREGWWGMMMH